MSFSFNPPKTDAAPGFSFGTPSGDAKGPNKPFGTGTAQTQQAFGTPTGQVFGQRPATTFSLGSTPVASTQSSSFGATPIATPTSSTGFGISLGGARTTATTSTSFSLGGPTVSTTTASTGFGISTPASSGGFSLGAAPANPAPTFNLGSTPASTASFDSGSAAKAPSLSFATPAAATSAATSAPSLGFGLGSNAGKTTPAANFSFSTPASSAPTGLSLSGALTTTSTALTSSSIPATGTLTFGQLEDSINKWTMDLEEQGKLFANQAKQLNAWDRLLISNGDKVLSLNNGIERVKQQQQQLDQELDFVLAQHKELEDLLTPLERELADVPITDADRGGTYQIAENVDTQLKQMTEDLKEIIEQLNESNKTQEMSNPITQIGKILNVHMNSLQWIDHNTTKITTHLDQISKMHDLNRKSHEINLKRTYD